MIKEHVATQNILDEYHSYVIARKPLERCKSQMNRF